MVFLRFSRAGQNRFFWHFILTRFFASEFDVNKNNKFPTGGETKVKLWTNFAEILNFCHFQAINYRFKVLISLISSFSSIRIAHEEVEEVDSLSRARMLTPTARSLSSSVNA